MSEMPEEWKHQVTIWHRILRARFGDLEGAAPPDRNDEYLLYQLMLGAWPAELTGVSELDADAVGAFAERLAGAMLKSVREAKQHTTWASPNTPYEDAVSAFVRAALDMSRPNAFLSAFIPFQEQIARLGVDNSLVQTVLKLTLPGMPDTYQGSELWDLSMVDPDNRRAVDYSLRDRMLGEIIAVPAQDRCEFIRRLSRDCHDGRIKLAITARLLGERRRRNRLFGEGGYEPVAVQGPKADLVCAFIRSNAEDQPILIAAARFPRRRVIDPGWDGTEIALPSTWPAGRIRDLLTGQVVVCEESGAVSLDTLFNIIPVAVLCSDRDVFD